MTDTYVPGQPYTRGMPVVSDETAVDFFRTAAFASFAGGERVGDYTIPQPPPGMIWKVDPDLLDLVAYPQEEK